MESLSIPLANVGLLMPILLGLTIKAHKKKKTHIGSVALLSHFDKVLALSKFALLKCEIYSCVLQHHITDSLGH